MKRPLIHYKSNEQPSDIGKSALECRVEFIKDAFGNTEDLLMLPILYHEEKGILFYLETISDSEKIQESILVPLSKNPELDFGDIPYTAETKSKIKLEDTINALLQGNTILIVQGEDDLFSFNTKKDLSRSPQDYSELDYVYRNPKGALGAKVAIIEGKAMDAIRLKQEETDLNGRYYDEFLKSGVATGFYTDYNVQSVCPLLLKHTKDPLLPLIKIHSKGHRAESVGMALFNNDKMTGKLTIPESKVFILLSGGIKQKVSFLVRTKHRYQQNQLNYVIVEILNSRPKTKLNVKNGAVTAKLALKLQYRIREYPKNHLSSSLLLKQLNNEINAGLTNTAKKTISKLQEANCDGLGIEEEIKVHHHRLWEGKYKNVAIKEIPIKVDLQLELLNSGIIN